MRCFGQNFALARATPSADDAPVAGGGTPSACVGWRCLVRQLRHVAGVGRSGGGGGQRHGRRDARDGARRPPAERSGPPRTR